MLQCAPVERLEIGDLEIAELGAEQLELPKFL